MATEIRVPALGESITEATVGHWLKQAGDAVAADEPLVELETEKVTVEVPAPASGVLSEIVVKAGDTVSVGALLGSIAAGEGKSEAGACSGQNRHGRAAARAAGFTGDRPRAEPAEPSKMQPAALEREPNPREEVSDSGNR